MGATIVITTFATSENAQVMRRFSDAGMTAYPRGEAAGVRKAPRHEIAVGGAPVGAAGAMGIWAGRACHGDLLAAIRAIALGQKVFVDSTLNARAERCARGLGVGRGGRSGATMQAGALPV